MHKKVTSTFITISRSNVKEAVARAVGQPVRRVRSHVAAEGRRECHAAAGTAQRPAAGRLAGGREGLRA